MSMTHGQHQSGTITHVNQQGLAYVSNERGQDYGFTFDKIANYRGEKASEIGLHRGSRIQFDEHDGKVSSVKIER